MGKSRKLLRDWVNFGGVTCDRRSGMAGGWRGGARKRPSGALSGSIGRVAGDTAACWRLGQTGRQIHGFRVFRSIDVTGTRRGVSKKVLCGILRVADDTPQAAICGWKGFPGPNPSKPTFLLSGDADPHSWKIEFQGWAVEGEVRRWFRSRRTGRSGGGNALTGGGRAVLRKGSDRVESCEQEGRCHNYLLQRSGDTCHAFSSPVVRSIWMRLGAEQRVAWLRCTGKSPLYGFSQCRRTPLSPLTPD
jgi:hypothetical protein